MSFVLVLFGVRAWLSINIIVQYNDRSLPDNLLLTQAPIMFVWFDGTIILMFVVLLLVALHGD